MKNTIIAGLALVGISVGALANADGHISAEQIEGAIKARQAQMQLYAFNLGTLGGMAKGEIDYDAATAAAAANNLAALAQLDQSSYWLPGSDSDSVEGSRALPAIWEDGAKVGEVAGAFVEAALAMQEVAGTDLAALQGAMGPLGQSCGGCHKPFRQARN